MYFTDVHPTGIGPQRQPGMFSASAPMAGYPKVYNIEMDAHEDLQIGALFGWTVSSGLEVVEKYKETLRRIQTRLQAPSRASDDAIGTEPTYPRTVDLSWS
jgi:hypothetical protein